jgi:hypothetical protein
MECKTLAESSSSKVDKIEEDRNRNLMLKEGSKIREDSIRVGEVILLWGDQVSFDDCQSNSMFGFIRSWVVGSL